MYVQNIVRLRTSHTIWNLFLNSDLQLFDLFLWSHRLLIWFGFTVLCGHRVHWKRPGGDWLWLAKPDQQSQTLVGKPNSHRLVHFAEQTDFSRSKIRPRSLNKTRRVNQHPKNLPTEKQDYINEEQSASEQSKVFLGEYFEHFVFFYDFPSRSKLIGCNSVQIKLIILPNLPNVEIF